MEQTEIKSNKPKKWLIVVIAMLIVLAIAASVIFISYNSPSKKLDRKLALADRYMTELKYEEAIALYKEVLEIEPRNIKAYSGLFDAYINSGNKEKALEVLDTLISLSASENNEDLAQEIERMKEMLKDSDVGEESATVTEPLDGPDDVFPILINLEPNGEVPGYGVLDDQYVMMEYKDKEPDYIYRSVKDYLIDDAGLHLENGEVLSDFYYDPDATSDDMNNFSDPERYPSLCWSETAGLVAYKSSVQSDDFHIAQPIMIEKTVSESLPGAYYDETTNTLTLDNYTGQFLNVSLMGNGFKLKLVGDNELTEIVVWGFMYGGSLTITGEGKLTLNGSDDTPAIRLECEDSPSCLMIDSNVTIEIKGGSGNVAVIDSTLDKGIYYLKPIEVKSTTGENLIRYFDTSKDHGTWEFRNTDETTPHKITIAPKEDK